MEELERQVQQFRIDLAHLLKLNGSVKPKFWINDRVRVKHYHGEVGVILGLEWRAEGWYYIVGFRRIECHEMTLEAIPGLSHSKSNGKK